MDKLPESLRPLPLFRDMEDGELLRLLGCLRARERHYGKGEILWEAGAPSLCVIVRGGLMLLREDLKGNRSILRDYGPGEFLGGTAFGAAESAPPSFVAARAETTVLLLESATHPCARRCKAHTLLLRNMAQALARAETRLLHKIDCLSRRTTREKLMAYLAAQTAEAGSKRVSVPYTRQELADILAVDRSAMCSELTRMQSDGLIRCDRRHFELLEGEAPPGASRHPPHA